MYLDHTTYEYIKIFNNYPEILKLVTFLELGLLAELLIVVLLVVRHLHFTELQAQLVNHINPGTGD